MVQEHLAYTEDIGFLNSLYILTSLVDGSKRYFSNFETALHSAIYGAHSPLYLISHDGEVLWEHGVYCA